MRQLMELVKMSAFAALAGLIAVHFVQTLTAAAIAVGLLYLLTTRVT